MPRRPKSAPVEVVVVPPVDPTAKLARYCRNLAETAAYGSLGERIAIDVMEMATHGELSDKPKPGTAACSWELYQALLRTALIAQREVLELKNGAAWLRYGSIVRLMFELRGDL